MHKLLPLLSGQLVITEILIERPPIEMVTNSGKAPRAERTSGPAPAQGTPTGSGLGLLIPSVKVKDGSLVIRDRQRETPALEAEGLAVSPADVRVTSEGGTSIERLSATGDFSAERSILVEPKQSSKGG